ncbi:MAG: pilus assembly protein [Myxococcales bacterium]|nr:pilus assembly protein [Myxococcales bacterium]
MTREKPIDRQRRRHAHARRKRGAAMVEAVIMLPVLLLILLGILFYAVYAESSAEARLRARSCAFRYALDGCEGAPPEGCEGAAFGGREIDKAETLDDPTHARNLNDPLSKLGDVPLLGSAIEGMFGRSITVRMGRTLEPAILRGTTVTASGRFATLCNTRTTSPSQIAKESICSALPAGICKD